MLSQEEPTSRGTWSGKVGKMVHSARFLGAGPTMCEVQCEELGINNDPNIPGD